MEEEKKKKKKLTLSGFSKKTHNAANYVQSRGKTSVVIEKKTPRRWGEKKFQSKDNNFNKPKSTPSYNPQKSTLMLLVQEDRSSLSTYYTEVQYSLPH